MGCGASTAAPSAGRDAKPVKRLKSLAGMTRPSTVEEDLAATKLAAVTRGRQSRTHLDEQQGAAIKVQAMFRGKRDRRYSAQVRAEFDTKEVKTSDVARLKRTESNRLQRVNDYAFVKQLGKGAYGQVYLANYAPEGNGEADGDASFISKGVGVISKATETAMGFVGLGEKPPQCAIKVLSRSILKRKRVGKNASAYDSVLGEIAVMKHLRHPNIVRLYEVIDDPDQDLLFMSMELVTGGDLSESINAKRVVPEDELRVWIRGLTLGLEHLHGSGVCHRDIKPENMLWDPSTRTCKLADFGISGFFRANTLGGDFLTATSGSLIFFAPEMCRSIKGAGYSGRAADLWACGVSIFMWLYFIPPFMSDNPPGLLKAISEEDIVWPEDKSHSAELVALVRGLLQKQPSDRSRIKDMRRDAFITRNGAEPLDQALPIVNAKDGCVVVPKSELHMAVERVKIQRRSLNPAPEVPENMDAGYVALAEAAEARQAEMAELRKSSTDLVDCEDQTAESAAGEDS